MRRRGPVLAILLLLPLLAAAGAEEGGHASGTMDFLGKVVNFLILFGGLTFAAWKPVKALLAKRAADVGETIRLAEADRTASEAKAEASRTKLAGLEGDVIALKTAAEEEGRRETERIALAARNEAGRLKKLTRQELDEQVRLHVRELKAYAATLATDLARERIRKRLTPESQAALIEKSIDRLTQLHEKRVPR